MNGKALGLDYPGVEAAMRMQGVAPDRVPALFADLQVMERAARAQLNAKHE